MDYPIIKVSIPGEEIVIDEREALHYLGYSKKLITEEDVEMIRKRTPEVKKIMSGRACYGRFPVTLCEGERIVLPFGEITSHNLTRNLRGCSEIYMFAATIGAAFDRMLQTTRVRSMAEAAILQAIGATGVEYVCDTLNQRLKKEAESEGYFAKPRYSPGFGDFPLENQIGFFRILNPSVHAGITLKDNLIMAPEKSVTALIGIGKKSEFTKELENETYADYE